MDTSIGIDFVRQSLELHLFFARIMKEHSFFLQLGFTPRDSNYTKMADEFRMQFDRLLADVISLSNGIISQDVLHSGEIVTPYTLNAERASSYYTGVHIPIELTQAEARLMGNDRVRINPSLEERVYYINQRAIDLIAGLIRFKANVLSNVVSCKMFSSTYPLMIDHVMREANLYLRLVQRMQNREYIDIEREAMEQEVFWNRIMAEHSKFIRGLLDPTEEDLIEKSNNFAHEFDQLTKESMEAMNKTIPVEKATEDTIRATEAIRDFKAQGTKGLIECKVKSTIIPLLGDHTLREANHFLRLLKIFEK